MPEELPPDRPFDHQKRTWRRKFGDAFRGVAQSVRVQSSYHVHFFFALLVPIAGWFLRLNLVEWCFVILLIVMVIVAEMFNTSIEELSRVVTENYDERVKHSLDIASGAVLLASGGAALLGVLIFVSALARLLST